MILRHLYKYLQVQIKYQKISIDSRIHRHQHKIYKHLQSLVESKLKLLIYCTPKNSSFIVEYTPLSLIKEFIFTLRIAHLDNNKI